MPGGYISNSKPLTMQEQLFWISRKYHIKYDCYWERNEHNVPILHVKLHIKSHVAAALELKGTLQELEQEIHDRVPLCIMVKIIYDLF